MGTLAAAAPSCPCDFGPGFTGDVAVPNPNNGVLPGINFQETCEYHDANKIQWGGGVNYDFRVGGGGVCGLLGPNSSGGEVAIESAQDAQACFQALRAQCELKGLAFPINTPPITP